MRRYNYRYPTTNKKRYEIVKCPFGKMSYDEHMELVYFCRQYSDKKKEAEALARSDERDIALRGRLLRDIALIENAAYMAGGDLAPWIIQSANRAGVRDVLADCPASDRTIHRLRHKFFFILREMRAELLDRC